MNKNISPCLSAFIGLTDRCNLNCKHCYSIKQQNNSQKNEISAVEIKEIAKSLKKLGTFSVQLSGGEPFLRKDMLKICKLFNKEGISLFINTNGVLLNKKLLMGLKKMSLDSLQISLDSIDKENFEMMRGKTGIYQKVKDNVMLSREFLGNKLCIGCVITSYNFDEIEKVAKFAKSNGIRIALIPLLTTGKANKSMDLTIEKKLKLINKLKDYSNLTFVVPAVFNKMFNLKNPYHYCSFPYHAAVMPNGDVFPCSGLRHVEKLKLGNIKSNNIKEIYEIYKRKD